MEQDSYDLAVQKSYTGEVKEKFEQFHRRLDALKETRRSFYGKSADHFTLISFSLILSLLFGEGYFKKPTNRQGK